MDKVDDFYKNDIIWKVHKFFSRNETPTVKKVLKVVNDDTDLLKFKHTTFYLLLKKNWGLSTTHTQKKKKKEKKAVL